MEFVLFFFSLPVCLQQEGPPGEHGPGKGFFLVEGSLFCCYFIGLWVSVKHQETILIVIDAV